MEKSKKSRFRTYLAAMAAIMGTALAATPAAAIDVSPGDYAALPSGKTLGALYLQYGYSNTLNVDGAGRIPDSELTAGVSLLRVLHYSDIGGVPVLYQAILPIGVIPTARIGGADRPVSDGIGDLSGGFTVFPVHSNEPTGTTIGLTGFVTGPTGSYNVKKISLGSGTWTLTPQIGVQQGLGKGFFLDTFADIALQFDHNEAGRKISRDPSTELQAYLRYQFDQKSSVSFGYAGLFGGKSMDGGTYTGLKTRSDQVRLFANSFVLPTVQIQGMIGTDLNAEGGFKQAITAQLRLLKVF